jgi:CubicO group peptidase (beta-lactamase class C family)
LSFLINTTQGPAGRSAGTLSWCGLANTYFWVDPAKRVAGVICTQILPFVDPPAHLVTDAMSNQPKAENGWVTMGGIRPDRQVQWAEGTRGAQIYLEDVMPDTEWTSARKMFDYYMDQSEGIEAARKRLYLAVIKGEVRARFRGRVYGPEWLKQIAEIRFDDDDRLALPPDIELSVEDVKRKWRL